MIGILNRTLLLPRLKLPKYYNVGLRLHNYLPWSTTPLRNPVQTLPHREMCKYVKPVSRKAINLQTSDGIPLDYDVIYNSFEYHTISQYGAATLATLYTICGTIHIVINFEDAFPDLHTSTIHLWLSSLFLYVNIGVARMAYKSPVRIYHNKKTGDYKAVFNGLKPFDKRILEFRTGMVEKIIPTDKLALFKNDRYKINNENLYMFGDCFRYSADLYGMFDDIETEE